ncbi:MAG: DUF2095 family protein [Candidatus Bathyarchaeia archaeon]
MMEIDKEQFRKMFPNLAREIEGGESKITISSIRLDPEEGEKAVSKRFDGYNPDVIDFLRRCDNEEQAEEIIAYLERRGEISQQYASSLRKQLKEKGIRSFGPKKSEAYYLREAGYR